ncbi:MAG: hypothetical protein S4CHLAM102_04890 [Chlamydiia bacterium]|nr:hypothetical protein [Chlamydiia bacterium]
MSLPPLNCAACHKPVTTSFRNYMYAQPAHPEFEGDEAHWIHHACAIDHFKTVSNAPTCPGCKFPVTKAFMTDFSIMILSRCRSTKESFMAWEEDCIYLNPGWVNVADLVFAGQIAYAQRLDHHVASHLLKNEVLSFWENKMVVDFNQQVVKG